jgi:Homeodomain-like domain
MACTVNGAGVVRSTAGHLMAAALGFDGDRRPHSPEAVERSAVAYRVPRCRPVAEHGTRARYSRGRCRCPSCVDANARYLRAWRGKRCVEIGQLPGTWVVAAVAVRAHMGELLAAGWSQRRIAAAAGMSHHTVARALAGGRVEWRNAQALGRIGRG